MWPPIQVPHPTRANPRGVDGLGNLNDARSLELSEHAAELFAATPIPQAATSVHGIRDANVANHPPFASLAPTLLSILEGCDLAGFGIASFDFPVLVAEFAPCTAASSSVQVQPARYNLDAVGCPDIARPAGNPGK